MASASVQVTASSVARTAMKPACQPSPSTPLPSCRSRTATLPVNRWYGSPRSHGRSNDPADPVAEGRRQAFDTAIWNRYFVLQILAYLPRRRVFLRNYLGTFNRLVKPDHLKVDSTRSPGFGGILHHWLPSRSWLGWHLNQRLESGNAIWIYARSFHD